MLFEKRPDQAVKYVLPTPATPQLMERAASPETISGVHDVTLTIQRSLYIGWLKMVSVLLLGGLIFLGIVKLTQALRLVRGDGVPLMMIIGGFLIFLAALAWGMPHISAARLAMREMPNLLQILYHFGEQAINEALLAAGDDDGIDLDGDGVASSFRGNFPVRSFGLTVPQATIDPDNLPSELPSFLAEMDNSQIEVSSVRTFLGPPFPQTIPLVHEQVMAFLKKAREFEDAGKGAFSRDNTWFPSGEPKIVLLPGTPYELEVTRAVYDAIIRALLNLGIIYLESRQAGYKMNVPYNEARRRIMACYQAKHLTTTYG